MDFLWTDFLLTLQILPDIMFITTLMALSQWLFAKVILKFKNWRILGAYLIYMNVIHFIMNLLFMYLGSFFEMAWLSSEQINLISIIIEYGFYVLHAIVFGVIIRHYTKMSWFKGLSGAFLSSYLSINVYSVISYMTVYVGHYVLGVTDMAQYTADSLYLIYILQVVASLMIAYVLKWIDFGSMFAYIFTNPHLNWPVTIFLFLIKDVYRLSYTLLTNEIETFNIVLWSVAFLVTFFLIAILYTLGQYERGRQDLNNTEKELEIQRGSIDLLEQMQVNLRYLRHDMQNMLMGLHIDITNEKSIIARDYLDDIVRYIEDKSNIATSTYNQKVEDKGNAAHKYHKVMIGIGVGLLLFFISISFLKYDEWVIVIGLLLLAVSIMTFGFISIYASLGREQRLRNSMAYQKEYMDMLNSVNKKLLDERNESLNQLASLTEALETGHVEHVKTFFINRFETMTQPFQNEIKNSYAFNNVQIPELQNMLIVKNKRAKLMSKQLKIEVVHQIKEIAMELPDVLRCVGILVDNALEVANTQDASIVMYNNGDAVTIIVSNSCDDTISVHDIYKDNVSSKGSHRGHGLGSYRAITDKYENVLTRTQIKDGSFIQTLRVEAVPC